MTVYEKINADVKSNCEKIDNNKFILRDIKCNRRCHLNSVQEALKDSSNEVILCMCIDSDSMPFVHFINKYDEVYCDNTLGWVGKEYYEYYIIRKISPSEYKDVSSILKDTKRQYINKYSTFIDKIFRRINEDKI